jgi:hypothetical protein
MSEILLTKVICSYEKTEAPDIGETIAAEFARNGTLFSSMRPGARIAIAVGSRGIANLSLIVGTVVAELRRRGAKPFIVPAMGSHGGATAEGQSSILRGYGIAESTVGAPVVSSMRTVELPRQADGLRVFMSGDAFESDGIVLVNRIKVHTDFHGEYESGLAKMSVIGLGKHAQALEIHARGVRGLRECIIPAAREIFRSGKILGGLAIVENACDETALLEIIPAAEILVREPRLLELSRRLMPRIPVDPLDLLVVDEMGKDISGVGMDPNIIGRIRVRGQVEPDYPRISSIVVCGLSAASHGNALGIGLADVATRSLAKGIDVDAMTENAVTSGFLERAKIPLLAETPRRAVEIALRAACVGPACVEPAAEGGYASARILRIRNTLSLREIFVSDALLGELSRLSNVEITDIRLPLFRGDELEPCFGPGTPARSDGCGAP